MKRNLIMFVGLLATVPVMSSDPVLSSDSTTMGHDVMQPRVPADRMAEARQLSNPLPDSDETIARGKALYTGKGTCINCHGSEGDGNGPVAAQLNPSPRNFQHHGFWRHRTEGEIFWVIKHGSPGTSMIGFADQLTDEDIWALIQYERTFAKEHGHGGGMGPGGMGHRGMGRGGGHCEGERCDR
ncbi:MAG TPA: c-type cytochrome [Nitrospira sp.]|nr:c-type cytochrome [Nitrospira sp.]